jgi:hypothetical protein
MAYIGQKISIPVGRGGLRTDLNQADIPATHLISAKNVEMRQGIMQKEPGSRRWNRSGFGSDIYGLTVYEPTSAVQDFVIVTKDGTVRRMSNPFSQVTVTAAASTDPQTLKPDRETLLIAGGAESINRSKKLFILTKNDAIQVIDGDVNVYRTITKPPSDWASAPPRFGFIHRSRFIAFGNTSDPHRYYVSSASDHEDFTTSVITATIDPGVGDALTAAFSYKGRAFFFKKPRGVWVLNSDDSNPANWFTQKLSDEFGIASGDSIQAVLDDVMAKNTTGSITSLSATQKFGDIEFGDILSNRAVEEFLKNQISPLGNDKTRSLYYKERKFVYFTYQGAGSNTTDLMLKSDIFTGEPEFTLTDKDQPNVFAVKSFEGSEKPFYGSGDGYIYEMDTSNREVGRVFTPDACTAALAGSGAGNLSNGTYRYKITFYDDTKESDAGAPSQALVVADNSTDGQASLTNIPLDTTLTATKRRVYRTEVDLNVFKLVGEIADNTTTTFTDNVADGSLGAEAPSTNTFNDAYRGEFQTPHLDFGQFNPELAEQNKIFDFLEVTYYRS